MVALIDSARGVLWGLALGLPLMVGGCATPPKDPAQRAAFEQTNDPLEPMNRAIFDFNDKAYTYVLFPVARVNDVIPSPARTGISKKLDNFCLTVVFATKALQGDGS